jgi:hypothetical protein
MLLACSWTWAFEDRSSRGPARKAGNEFEGIAIRKFLLQSYTKPLFFLREMEHAALRKRTHMSLIALPPGNSRADISPTSKGFCSGHTRVA